MNFKNNKNLAVISLIILGIFSATVSYTVFTNKFNNNTSTEVILEDNNTPLSYILNEEVGEQVDRKDSKNSEVIEENLINNINITNTISPNLAIEDPIAGSSANSPIHSISDIPWTQHPIDGIDTVGTCNGNPVIKARIVSPNGPNPHFTEGHLGKLDGSFYTECMSSIVDIKWIVGNEGSVFSTNQQINFDGFAEGTYKITLLVGASTMDIDIGGYYTSESSIEITIGSNVRTNSPPTISIHRPSPAFYAPIYKHSSGYFYVKFVAVAEVDDYEIITNENMEWHIEGPNGERTFIGNGPIIDNVVYILPNCHSYQYRLHFTAVDPTGLSSSQNIHFSPTGNCDTLPIEDDLTTDY